MKITLTFRLRNETKGALRYQELKNGEEVSGNDAVVGGLYIRKTAINTPYPSTITLTIEA